MGRTLRSAPAITIGLMIAIITLLLPFSVSCSKPPAPTAAFSASYVSGDLLIGDPIAGTAPLTVRFTDQSSGEITSWRWSLGDGTVVKGVSDEVRDFTHEYKTPNSSGYIVLLTVRGPGGTDDEEKSAIVTVQSCPEAATTEVNQAKKAIQACLSAAGKTALDSGVLAWDGSRGQVTSGGKDAADYLGVWKTFRATYIVEVDGDITQGTDVSWGCVYWNPTSPMGARWSAT
jgi:PKD repeat protein